MNQKQRRKRRRAHSESPTQSQFPWLSRNWEGTTRPEDLLFIEAHEADLVFSNETAANMLEAPMSHTSVPPEKGAQGSGLVKWEVIGGAEEVWVDRYDARLLLSSIPLFQQGASGSGSAPPSPSGWSDLPSDTEDTFFLEASEVEDVRREKRRRLLDASRSERLRAMQATDPEVEQDEIWGDNAEEPDDAQKELMRRTATHLLSSPNPVQLEARILANHGADRRFAFLRGRWRNAWSAVKQDVRADNLRKKQLEEEESRKKASKGNTLTGLADYGDSDDDDGVNEPENAQEQITTSIADAKMEARRARAKEWAAKRRAEKVAVDSSS